MKVQSNPSALTLGIDTTGPSASLSLLRGGELLGGIIDPSIGYAERLLPALLELIERVSLDISAIDRIAVCSGPGSFTGIRTGFASAQGLAFARGLPVLGVSSLLCRLLPTLDALGLGETASYLPMVTAREDEHFVCELSAARSADGLLSVSLLTPVFSAHAGDFASSGVGQRGTVSNPLLLDFPVESGSVLAARCFELCAGLAREGTTLEGLFQLTAAGIGLRPVYVKGVNAKTIEERLGS